MKKYIFFDVDGTLTDRNPGGVVPRSTHEALEQLKKNGHFVAIATGRSYSSAKKYIEKTDIHNIVCCGGNGLVIDDEVVYIHPLDKNKALLVINECIEKGIPLGVNIDDSSYIYTHCLDLCERCPEIPTFANVQYINHQDYSQFKEIHKIHIGIKRGHKIILDSLNITGLHYARYLNHSIVVEPDDKYKGILDMIHYIGGKEEDVVVFGDGHNDLSMMKQAPIGIAMGNAINELKEVATFVTKNCNDGGIEYACKYYHWI